MKKIIIIGAGIVGASTAYHLAKEGASVTVIDRNDNGQATDAAERADSGQIANPTKRRPNRNFPQKLCRSMWAHFEPRLHRSTGPQRDLFWKPAADPFEVVPNRMARAAIRIDRPAGSFWSGESGRVRLP